MFEQRFHGWLEVGRRVWPSSVHAPLPCGDLKALFLVRQACGWPDLFHEFVSCVVWCGERALRFLLFEGVIEKEVVRRVESVVYALLWHSVVCDDEESQGGGCLPQQVRGLGVLQVDDGNTNIFRVRRRRRLGPRCRIERCRRIARVGQIRLIGPHRRVERHRRLHVRLPVLAADRRRNGGRPGKEPTSVEIHPSSSIP